MYAGYFGINAIVAPSLFATRILLVVVLTLGEMLPDGAWRTHGDRGWQGECMGIIYYICV